MVRPLIVVAGPTASGKSALALALAESLGGEIVGCDSVQIYRGFDLGSAKPTIEERARVTHHMVDVRDWHEDYDAATYAAEARAAIASIEARGKHAIVVGGTGLYLRALLGQSFDLDLPKDEALRESLRALPTDQIHARLSEIDPRRASELHANDRVRLVRALEIATLRPAATRASRERVVSDDPFASRARILVLDPPRPDLHARIAHRCDAMIAAGILDETRSLLAHGVDPACKPMQSIGYKQCAAHLDGRGQAGKSLAQEIVEATRQYAKRQTTWFRKVDAAARLPTPDLRAALSALQM